jgi:hypothetical protein
MNGARQMVTPERLREVLNYDPSSGVFVWLVTLGNRAPKGTIAGRDNGNGYRRIAVDCHSYYAHRLAWVYIHDEWPENEIDHIDGNTMNNRITNLRQATNAQNMQNLVLRSTNTSGMMGVSWLKSLGKWEAYICVNCKKIGLGYFEDRGSASEAYLAAKQKLHPFQPIPRILLNDCPA